MTSLVHLAAEWPPDAPRKHPDEEGSRTVRKLLKTSASQYETFELCARKWWIGKFGNEGEGLEEPTTFSQAFGTVLHGVCERYALADDLGRDKSGQPVNLYPPNWHIAYNKYTGEIEGVLAPMEQDLVQQLVNAAIEGGVLDRPLNREIEHQFQTTVCKIPCPMCSGAGHTFERTEVNCPWCVSAHGRTSDDPGCLCMGSGKVIEDNKKTKCTHCKGDGVSTHVQVVGFIDVCLPDEIRDHKTTSKMRYAKSPAKLRDNIQILIYAKIQLIRLNAQGIFPQSFKVRHNVFCKDPADLKVRKTEVVVSLEEIENNWKKIGLMSFWMDYYRRTAKRWSDIPDPPTGNRACSAYSGCAFLSICTCQEDEKGYAARLAMNKASKYTGQTPLTVNGQHVSGDLPMSQVQSRMPVPSAFAGAIQGQPGQPVRGAMPPGINPPQAQTQYQPAQVSQQGAPPQPQQAAPMPQQFQPPAQQYQPAPPQAQQQAPQQQPAPTQFPAGVTAPPWANPGCQACGGFGMDTKGNPCRPCDHLAATTPNGQPSGAYNLTPQGNGLFHWAHKADSNYQGMSAYVPNGQAPVVQERTDYSQPQAPQGQQQPPAAEEEKGKGKGKGGRPAQGFMLLINTPVNLGGNESRGKRKVTHLHLAAASLMQQIAQGNGVASFYDLEVNRRRDLLARSAPSLVESFEDGIVVADGIGYSQSDIRAVFDAIRPYAGFEAGTMHA